MKNCILLPLFIFFAILPENSKAGTFNEVNGKQFSATKIKDEYRPPRGALKINLSPLLFKTLSLQFEHAIHRKFSLGIQYNRIFEHKVPFVRFRDPNRTDPTIEGFNLTPEFRFYPRGRTERPAPHGFYLGAYLRYAKRFIRWSRYQPDYTLHNSITYTAYTYGVFIGKQWMLGKHFSIDWCMVGIGYGTSKIEGGFYIPEIDIPEAVQEVYRQEYADAFNGYLGRVFGFSGASFNTTTNSLHMVVRNVPTYSFRLMGLSLGYAF